MVRQVMVYNLALKARMMRIGTACIAHILTYYETKRPLVLASRPSVDPSSTALAICSVTLTTMQYRGFYKAFSAEKKMHTSA